MTYSWPFAKTEGQLIAICIIYGYVITWGCRPFLPSSVDISQGSVRDLTRLFSLIPLYRWVT